MTLLTALDTLHRAFLPVSGDFAESEAERVLMFLCDCSRSHLHLNGAAHLPDEYTRRIEEIAKRRARDEPLAFILGSAYFFDREFTVTPDVLIPRPDTEILVETVMKYEKGKGLRFFDFGTGSGCIAAILSAYNTTWRALAIDCSRSALAVARRNCPPPVSLLCCDRFSALKPRTSFDFIVSNPPYISGAEIKHLPESVRSFEPTAALDGGPDGLDFYRYLALNGNSLLKKNGRIYCEIGYDQESTVPELFAANGWAGISVIRDLGNRSRVVCARQPEDQP